MTDTLIREQPSGAVDAGKEAELVKPEGEKAELRKLAELLAQAYVVLPLFP